MNKKIALHLLGCLAAGIVSALAMAPANIFLALFVGLSAFYILLSKATSGLQAFFFGWAFGAGYFITSLSWIGNALLVEGNPYIWAWPLAVIGFPGSLGLFTAFSGWAIHKFATPQKLSGLLSFTGFFALFEWLRGHVFTGFPWNLFGYTWVDILPIVQIVSFSNVYFLTLLTIFWAALPGFLYLSNQTTKLKIITASCAVLLFATCFGYGSWRLQTHQTEYVDDVSLRIVQPNILQSKKWDRTKIVSNFYVHVELSYSDKTEKGTTYVIWPETALSHWFVQDKSSMLAIGDALNSYDGNAHLLTGILRRTPESKTYFNSLMQINEKRETKEVYDKSHLVPFGEYIPYQSLIPIGPVSQFSGLTPGDGIQTLTTKQGLRYSPLICYEIIFPGKVIRRDEPSPDVMINITNDAWYSFSAGPHQHFVHAVFRAIEEGIPVARSANTGFSGLVDPLGRILHKTELFEENTKNLLLPKKIRVFKGSYIFETLAFLALSLVFCLSGAALSRLFTNTD